MHKDVEGSKKMQLKITKIIITSFIINQICLWWPWKLPAEAQCSADHNLNTQLLYCNTTIIAHNLHNFFGMTNKSRNAKQYHYLSTNCRRISVTTLTNLRAARKINISDRYHWFFSSPKRPEFSASAHSASIFNRYDETCFPPRVKRPGRVADYSPPTSAKFKNEWRYTSTPPNMIS